MQVSDGAEQAHGVNFRAGKRRMRQQGKKRVMQDLAVAG